jgi:DNA polymerase V
MIPDFAPVTDLLTDAVYLRPLFLCTVHAGPPSPADDEIDCALDLNRHIFKRPETTIMVWMKGNAFRGEGIFDGDLLIADSSLEPHPGQLVVALVKGQQAVKRLSRLGDNLYLTTDGGPSELIEAEGNPGVQVLAVVTFTIHTFPD